MSDDAQPVSVAELLARNGKQASGSGGRRRRGRGGGISVAELTGDLAPVREPAEDTTVEPAALPAAEPVTSSWAAPAASVEDLDATGAWPSPSVAPLRKLPDLTETSIDPHKPLIPAGYQPVVRAPRPELADFPTAAWAMTSQDQQLLSGPSLASDLLRSRGDEEDPTDEHDRVDVDDIDEAETGDDTGDDADKGAVATSRRDRKQAAASWRKWLPQPKSEAAPAKPAADETDGDAPATTAESLRPWLVLGGQAVVAAVAGMLIFKGFQRLWVDLPWIALALAIIVIVGMVAVVRILRKTDDVVSMLIAVAVGVFVTVGPLVFTFSSG